MNQSVIPDFVAIGHVTRDLHDDGRSWSPGGSVAYAAVAAARLGRKAAVVTSCEDQLHLEAYLPPEVGVARTDAPVTTTFRNQSAPSGRRTQFVSARAQMLDVEHIPYGWLDPQILLAAPVINEVDPTMLGRFRRSLIGAAGQGWLRRWSGAPDMPVGRDDVTALAALPPVGALLLSDEDFDGGLDALLPFLESAAPITIVTHGEAGADLHWAGDWHPVAPFPARETDPTGAGDVFAGAFLVRLSETRDPMAAARFASAAASLSVEASGPLQSAPTREAVERRIAEGESSPR